MHISMESKVSNLLNLVLNLMSIDAQSRMLYLQSISKQHTCHQRPCSLISKSGSLTPIDVKNSMEVSSLMLLVRMQLIESLFNTLASLLNAQITPVISMSRILSKVNLHTYGLTLTVLLILLTEDLVMFLKSLDATVRIPSERSLLTLKKSLFQLMILMR